MILVLFVLFYLVIVKKFELLLLLFIFFGMFLVNLLLVGLMDEGGVINIMFYGVKSNLFFCLVFMGVGVMIDFFLLIVNFISLILGVVV